MFAGLSPRGGLYSGKKACKRGAAVENSEIIERYDGKKTRLKCYAYILWARGSVTLM